MLQSRTLMRGLVRGKGWLLLTLWVTGDEEVRLAVVIGSDWSVVIDSVVFVISSVGGVVVYAGMMRRSRAGSSRMVLPAWVLSL